MSADSSLGSLFSASFWFAFGAPRALWTRTFPIGLQYLVARHLKIDRVLRQSAVANLGEAKRSLKNPKWTPYICWDVYLGALQLIYQLVMPAGLIQRPVLTQHHRDVPVRLLVGLSDRFALVRAPTAQVGRHVHLPTMRHLWSIP